MRRVGVFGWGVVAPRSRDVEAFVRNLESQESWLTPFDGFGPDNFLVGRPEFDLRDYEGWIAERFPPNRFQQIERKMGLPVQFAIGSFIQALSQNPGIEAELQALGPRAHVYIGTGLGDLPTAFETSLEYVEAQRRWNRFWADPSRNAALAAHRRGEGSVDGVPRNPEELPWPDRLPLEDAWNDFWMRRSAELAAYLAEMREIEALNVEGAVESGKARVLRRKMQKAHELQQRWGAPEPPWNCVTANLLWNIHNTPASQVSMLGRIRGMVFAPVAACSTFGYALKLAMNAIRLGEAKAVVIGATDPPPHPMSVGSFCAARVLSADGSVSKPLTGLRGTHIAGGSIVWIVGDLEHMTARGFRPLGMEPIGVGVTADAEHIITPSPDGPTLAIEEALRDAGIDASSVTSWDLHATATPGDYLEVETLRRIVSDRVLLTARKGTFGHGMGVGGGWELMAQYLGAERGKVFATSLGRGEIHPEIARLHAHFACDAPCDHPDGVAGKLSMGVGGINACVLSRRYGDIHRFEGETPPNR